MTRIEDILFDQYQQYPDMELLDMMKCIYQNEFGCGHLIADHAGNYELLLQEMQQVEESEEALTEPIGNGYVRLHLRAAKREKIDTKVLETMFLETAKKKNGTNAGFLEKVKILEQLSQQGRLPFAPGEIRSFCEAWKQEGYPIFRHSKRYRELYNPAYRVIAEEYVDVLPLLGAIQKLQREKGSVVIGIEGRCGAGKTTLSGKLCRLLEAQEIHMDSFFLPLTLRTKDRLEEPGGNIHYERFEEEVVKGIKSKAPFTYRIFDCAVMDYNHIKNVPKTEILIIEGVYAMHPRYEMLYDYKIFCDISKEKQRERITKRDGAEQYMQFEQRWIPMEERYFGVYDVCRQCDVILKTI